MNRRAFLRALGFGTVAAAAAVTLEYDLEKLLWVPGEKTIFLPAAADVLELGGRGSVFITPAWITKETAAIFVNALRLPPGLMVDHYRR